MSNQAGPRTVADFLAGKSPHTTALFHHLVDTFQQVAEVELRPTKSMIGIVNQHGGVAWVTQLGKNFVHVVFPFREPHVDNLCFVKIAQVPGDAHQFNHHFRMFAKEDLNEEVIGYMRKACEH